MSQTVAWAQVSLLQYNLVYIDALRNLSRANYSLAELIIVLSSTYEAIL